MSRYNDTGMITATPDGDIPLYARVTKTATGVAVAGAGDPFFGSALRQGFADDPTSGQQQQDISVKMFNASGTHFAIAAGPIADGATIGGAADGKIEAGAGAGIALEEALADGDVIEVAYFSP